MPSTKNGRLSKWWPISFFLLTAIFLIISIALSVKWGSNSYDKCRDAYQNHREDFDNDKCVNQDNGLLYGAVVCYIIAGGFGISTIVFLIFWCTRRNRSRQNYEQQQPFLQPQPYGHPEQGIPFKQYPVPEHPPTGYAAPNYPAAPEPMYDDMHNQHPPAAAATPLK